MVMKMLCFRPNSKPSKEEEEDSHHHNIHGSNNNTIIHNEEKSDYEYDDDDLYKFYHLDECQISTTTTTTTSKGYYYKVDSDMRRDVIDWLIDTHFGLELMPETLYLCVNILDRFLSKATKFEETTTKEAKRKQLELVGVTSLLLASKYEQQNSLSVYDLEYITQYSCTPDEICEMESLILQELNWVLTVPTPYVFLLRNMRAWHDHDNDDDDDDEKKIMENMVFFLCELSLTHYPIVCGYKPSVIAASAVYCARVLVGRYPFWGKTLETCTGYSVKRLRPCAKAMMKLCSATCRDQCNTNMGVFRKFSSPSYCKVACVAKQELSKNLSCLGICFNFKCLLEN